jgi:hypothetical protein
MINSIRSLLYALARWLGDANAVNKKRVGKRVGWRISGKATSKFLNKLWK